MEAKHAAPSVERVEFRSGRELCVGDLHHPPEHASNRALPALILGNGYGGLRSALNPQAQMFAAAGYRALTIDYRFFGESGGQPRSQLFPLAQVEDFRSAISYMSERDDVDSDAIGIWGLSFGGGVVLYTAAVDLRVRAVIAQAPVVDGYSWMRGLRNPVQWTALLESLSEDRRRRYHGEESAIIPRMAPQLSDTLCGLPADEQLMSNSIKMAELRRARGDGSTVLTLESIEKIMEFSPESIVHRIAPRPTLIVTTAGYDIVHPYEAIARAFEKAAEPKKLIPLRMSQLEVYEEAGQKVAFGHQLAWLREAIPLQSPK